MQSPPYTLAQEPPQYRLGSGAWTLVWDRQERNLTLKFSHKTAIKWTHNWTELNTLESGGAMGPEDLPLSTRPEAGQQETNAWWDNVELANFTACVARLE